MINPIIFTHTRMLCAADADIYGRYPWIAPFPSSPDGGGSFGWRAKACLRYALADVRQARADAERNATAAGRNATAAVQRAGATYEQFVAASMNSELESAKHTLASLLEAALTSADCAVDEFCMRAVTVLQSWGGCAGGQRYPSLHNWCRSDWNFS
jgi:uncharacterized membrane protein